MEAHIHNQELFEGRAIWGATFGPYQVIRFSVLKRNNPLMVPDIVRTLTEVGTVHTLREYHLVMARVPSH